MKWRIFTCLLILSLAFGSSTQSAHTDSSGWETVGDGVQPLGQFAIDVLGISLDHNSSLSVGWVTAVLPLPNANLHTACNVLQYVGHRDAAFPGPLIHPLSSIGGHLG